MTLSIQAEPVRPRRKLAGLLVLLGASIAACSSPPREIAIQNANAGDLLVETGQSRVELVKPFAPGIANGQFKGVVKVTSKTGSPPPQLYEVSAVCSIKGEPDWPAYDNLYGNPISSIKKAGSYSEKSRWQILYHFDGRIEKKGNLESDAWASRLKDNLCRKGSFDNRKVTNKDKA
jgi:hypothetical protein